MNSISFGYCGTRPKTKGRSFSAMKIMVTFAFILNAPMSVPAAPRLFGASDTEPMITAQPVENLLLIVADIQRHIKDDIFRFPYPVDANGQNVFRAGIVKLSNYEKAYPGNVPDVIALAKAQAFERLCSFQEAGANYELAQSSKDERIRKLGLEGFERTKKISQITDVVPDQSSPRTWERDIRQRISLLKDLQKELADSSTQCLLKLEQERAQIQLAEFYIKVRFIRPYTLDEALKQIRTNIEDNKRSKSLYVHRLMLGDLYFELAKEYTYRHDPEGPEFRLREFEDFAKSARAEYDAVEKADGFDEKQEGKAKLQALESFAERVGDRAR
jgi:hypothetical protein